MRTKHSVSVAIHDGEKLLVVQRPADDEDLPNAWGLPAASLRAGESWEEAARRAGRDKLGVELRLDVELQRGSLQRPAYRLEMRLYSATLASGAPQLPHHATDVTLYQNWKWGTPDDLRPAASSGSLCCQLYLQWHDAKA